MRSSQQIKTLFIPKINARLKTDAYRPLGNTFEQTPDILSYTKDLVDEVDIVNTACNYAIHLGEDLIHVALAELIAEQCLITERASPWTSTRKFQLGTVPLTPKDMVTMFMAFYVVIDEIEGFE